MGNYSIRYRHVLLLYCMYIYISTQSVMVVSVVFILNLFHQLNAHNLHLLPYFSFVTMLFVLSH